jgi:hypothetical protein
MLLQRDTFLNAYEVLSPSLLPSKMKETQFQAPNRIIWTRNKAFKSGMAPDPTYLQCKEPENNGTPLICLCKLFLQHMGARHACSHHSPLSPQRQILSIHNSHALLEIV